MKRRQQKKRASREDRTFVRYWRRRFDNATLMLQYLVAMRDLGVSMHELVEYVRNVEVWSR